MRTITCDECSKQLDPKQDKHYSIGSIEYNNPQSRHVQLRTEASSQRTDITESWTEYTDVDFCIPCFEKTGFHKYLKK